MTSRVSRLIVATVAVLALGAGVGAAIASSGDFGEKKDAFLADVAQRLGVTPEALDAAIKGARVAQVERALKDGDITQEQADAAKEAIESGEGRGFGPGFGHRGFKGGFGHHGPGSGIGLDAAAGYLGLSVDALRDELRSGKSLATIAGEKGTSVDGLREAMLKDATARLDEAVTAGRITEEQKSRLVERLSQSIDRAIERTPRAKSDASNAPAVFQGAFA